MRKHLCLAALGLALSGACSADPGVWVGLTYDFGGQLGVSLKVLTTDHQDRPALAAGVTYMPTTKSFGADAGVAYVFQDSAVTFGWDFLHDKYQAGFGFMDTK